MPKKLRLALCLSILPFISGFTPVSDVVEGDFCARLAKDAGIDKPASADGRTSWEVSSLNFGQRFLFGGTSTIGVGVEPIDAQTIEDYQRIEDMCQAVEKGAACDLAGPALFQLTWKGKTIETPIHAGEAATVTVRGTKTMCQSTAP